MPRDKVSTPGKFSKQTFVDKKYQEKSRADEKNTYMRSFSRTKLKTKMQAYDSSSYIFALQQYLSVASTAGVLETSFSNAWDKTWEYGHSKGNMKDLVAGQETALGLIAGNMLQITFDLMVQNIYRTLLPVFTESDAGMYWTQTSFDNFVNQLEGTPMPTFVVNFVKAFAFIVKLSEEYELHSITVPPSYLAFFYNYTANSTLAVENARKLIVQANLANGIAQAEKFGIPMTKFSASMIDFQIKTLDDPDVRAMLNHSQFSFYAGEQVKISPAGRMGTKSCTDDEALNITTDYTNRKYFFKGNGPDSIIDAFAPLLGTYDVTNNPNGGWFITTNATAEAGKVGLVHGAHYATNLSTGTVDEMDYVLLLFLATWQGIAITDGDPPSFVMNINSDNGAQVHGIGGETNWQYAYSRDLWYGTSITYTQSLEFLLSNLVRLTYGGAKS